MSLCPKSVRDHVLCHFQLSRNSYCLLHSSIFTDFVIVLIWLLFKHCIYFQTCLLYCPLIQYTCQLNEVLLLCRSIHCLCPWFYAFFSLSCITCFLSPFGLIRISMGNLKPFEKALVRLMWQKSNVWTTLIWTKLVTCLFDLYARPVKYYYDT